MDHYPDWQKKEYPDIQACLKAVADRQADCVLISNYQYSNLRRQCDRQKLTALSTGKNVNYYIAIRRSDTELYSILTRTTDIISSTNTNAALSYFSAEEAKTTLIDFIRDNPAVDIAVVVVIIALLTVIVTQQKIIRARKEVEESHHQVEDLNKPVTLRRRGECTIDTTRDGFQLLIVQVSHIRFFRSFLYFLLHFLLRFAFRRILFYFFAEAVVQFFVFHMNTLLKKN